MLRVNEIFETLQGEAFFTGMPSLFVRLQGCAVGCPWCDTKHTWHANQTDRIGLAEVLAKNGDAPTFAEVNESVLMAAIEQFDSRHVVITGGEPCDYDLHELTTFISKAGKTVQIETSGTRPVKCTNTTWVTLSPKIDMPGGFSVLDQATRRADEIKMPVGRARDIDKLDALLGAARLRNPMVWLQPLSQSAKATSLCVETARERNWRVSIQTHKYAGLR